MVGPLTPQSIKLKFDTDDCICGVSSHAKNGVVAAVVAAVAIVFHLR